MREETSSRPVIIGSENPRMAICGLLSLFRENVRKFLSRATSDTYQSVCQLLPI
jgi:hypothetical protein